MRRSILCSRARGRASTGFAVVTGLGLGLLSLGQIATAAAQYSGPVAITQHTETVGMDPLNTDQILTNITAGAVFNSGNTNSYSGSVGGRFLLVRQPNQLTLEVLGSLGSVKDDATGDYVKTSANVFGKARYDRYLSAHDALFAAVAPRRDTFAGLDLRLQMQLGYLRDLYAPSADNRLWTEVGYDLTFDNFAPIDTVEPVAIDTTGIEQPGVTITATRTVTARYESEFINSARLFLGYTNALSSFVMMNVGVESLFDLEDGKNVRINAVADLATSISAQFKLGVVARTFWDNVPVPGKEKADFVMTLQVVYSYDSLTGAKKEEACDCSEDVAAAKQACAAGDAVPVLVPPSEGGEPGQQQTPPADVAPATAPVLPSEVSPAPAPNLVPIAPESSP